MYDTQSLQFFEVCSQKKEKELSTQITDGLVQAGVKFGNRTGANNTGIDPKPHMLVVGGSRVGRAGISVPTKKDSVIGLRPEPKTVMLPGVNVGDDGVVYLEVCSYGQENWVRYLRNAGFHIGGDLDPVLDRIKPSPTTVTKIAILPGELFPDGKRSFLDVQVRATELGMSSFTPEEICLLRVKLTVPDIEQLELEDIRCYSGTVRSQVVIGREHKVAGSLVIHNLDNARDDMPKRSGYAFVVRRNQTSASC